MCSFSKLRATATVLYRLAALPSPSNGKYFLSPTATHIHIQKRQKCKRYVLLHAVAMGKDAMEVDNVALVTSKKNGWQTIVPKKNPGKRKEPSNAPTTLNTKAPKVLKNSMKKTLVIGSSTSSPSESESGNDTDNESLEAGEIRQFTVLHKKKTAKLVKVDEVSDAEELPSNTNRFAALPIEEDIAAKEPAKQVEAAVPKPPPIIVPGVHSITDMLADLGEVTEPGRLPEEDA